jgi:diaminopimelate decarboxylase
VLELVAELQNLGIGLKHIDLGGGLGIRYDDEQPPHPDEHATAIKERLRASGISLPIHIEPGRAIAGNAGILLTRVEYLKRAEQKNFAVVDAAMNDLMRPALYRAYHNIVAVTPRHGEAENWEIVGPVCETGDVLGNDRKLALEQGDLLAVQSAGAYGFTMSSNYNSRPRAAEVMVDGAAFHVIRKRETIDDLIAGESIPEA